MDEMEYDRTRKAIGTDRLGSKDRKELMNKFTGAGGQVLGEKALRKQQEEEAARSGRGGKGGRGGGGGSDIKLPSQIAREKQREESERQAKMRALLEAEERAASGFLSRFGIKFRCMLNGLTPFGQDMVRPEFLSKLNLDAKRAIMECQILGNDLLMNNRKTAQAIVRELDKRNPILAETLHRAAGLYDRNELSELVGSYSSSSDTAVPLDSMRAALFSVLRKLYYLKGFQETYLTACELAIDVQQREEGKSSSLYAQKKKRIRTEWKKLMNDIYPDLVLLAQRAEMKKAEPGTRLFEEMIGVVQADKLGVRKAGEPVGGADPASEEPKSKPPKEPKAEESEDAAEDEEDLPGGEDEGAEGVEDEGEEGEGEAEAPKAAEGDHGSRELGYGYRIMRIMSVPALRQKHDPRGEYADLEDRDKALIAYLFFKEFEEEYSFILTTPKIKVQANYHGGVKQDYKQKMRDVFDAARTPEDLFRKYAHEASEYHRVVREKNPHMSHIDRSKKISLLESRRGASGRTVRIEIKDYMESVYSILGALIEDMRGPGEVVANKDEPIQFEIERDKRKRLHGKPVKDCIMQAYCFCLALADRLEHGDLFGGVLEMSEEDYQSAFAAAG